MHIPQMHIPQLYTVQLIHSQQPERRTLFSSSMKGTDPMRRILLVLTLLIALLAMPAAAFAQDAPTMPPVACGDLSEDDCAFLQDSRAASQELASYNASVTIDFALTDVPNLPRDVSFSLASDSAFSLNPDLAAQMADLQANMADDPAMVAQGLMDIAVGFYQDTQFDTTWDITLSQDVAALLSQQAGLELPETLNLPMRLVDGFFYANLDDLAQVVPGLSGWIGFDIAGYLAATMDQSMAVLEESMSSMDPALMGAMISSNAVMNPELQAAVSDNTTVERLEDATVDGTDVAQFRSSFDLGGFLSNPTVIDMIVQQARMQVEAQAALGQDTSGMTDADIQMVADMLPMLAPMLLSGIQWETNSSIGIEDLQVYTSETNISWDLGSVISMAGAMMNEQPARTQGAPAFSLDVRTENSNFNGDVQVEAPEGAQIVPLDQVMASSD